MTRPRRNLNLLIVFTLLTIAACSSVIIIGKHNVGTALENTDVDTEFDSINVFTIDHAKMIVEDTTQ